jgi:glycosyltransferase involved in cell wall biosynthesis
VKVLHVIPSVGPLRGGPTAAVRAIARGLADHGIFVDVVTTDDNAAGRLTVPFGRPVIEHGVTYWFFRRQVGFYTVSWPLSQWLAAHVADYDLVHIHALFSFPASAGAFWAARRGVPYVVRPLGVLNTWGIRNRRPLLKRISLRFIERQILFHASAVHFTSEQEQVEAHRSAPGVRSFIVPNPVETLGDHRKSKAKMFFARYPELAGRRVILFLSRLDPKKGMDLLLDAFAKLRVSLPEAVLVVAGIGEDSFVGRLRERAHRLGVQRDVIWAGFLEGEARQSAFDAAEVFVLSSYSENFGIAVVEAMSSGLPVILSDQVGIHREVMRAKAGIVTGCDAGEIARALVTILSDTEKRFQMARNARMLAMKFSPETVGRWLIEVYRNLREDKAPPRRVAASRPASQSSSPEPPAKTRGSVNPATPTNASEPRPRGSGHLANFG